MSQWNENQHNNKPQHCQNILIAMKMYGKNNKVNGYDVFHAVYFRPDMIGLCSDYGSEWNVIDGTGYNDNEIQAWMELPAYKS